MNLTTRSAFLALVLSSSLAFAAGAGAQPQVATRQTETATANPTLPEGYRLPALTVTTAAGHASVEVTFTFPNGGCSQRRFVPFYRLAGTTVQLWFRNESTPEACDDGPDHIVRVLLPAALQRAAHLEILTGQGPAVRAW